MFLIHQIPNPVICSSLNLYVVLGDAYEKITRLPDGSINCMTNITTISIKKSFFLSSYLIKKQNVAIFSTSTLYLSTPISGSIVFICVLLANTNRTFCRTGSQYLPENLDIKAPSVGTLLAYLETTAYITYITFRNKTFLFFKIES